MTSTPTYGSTPVTAVTPGAPTLTLVEGSSLWVGEVDGSLRADQQQGLFVGDVRILSRWDLSLDNSPIEAVAAYAADSFRGSYVGRAPGGGHGEESTLLVDRSRLISGGLREDLTLRNQSPEPVTGVLTLEVDADFAHLFEVRSGVRTREWERQRIADGSELRIEGHSQGQTYGFAVRAAGANAQPGQLSWQVSVPAHGQWSTTILVEQVVDGDRQPTAFPPEVPLADTAPARRLHRWQADAPRVRSDHPGLQQALLRSHADLGALRIADPDVPGRDVVAAGAPWYMALFGRDSLLTAYMALPLDPGLALGTLQTLAQHQGERVDPATEEEPGRILHELRLGAPSDAALSGGGTYYGTADATPLFVVLLGELHRWGAADEDVRALLPHADRALDWVRDHADADGDGFVEYAATTASGLRNQGWKDSSDGINFAEGRLAEAPIALCEVQGYVYAAYRARAALARHFGDAATAERCEQSAAELKRRFHDQFWLPERGWYAVALDRDKRPVDSCTSNLGHLLWSGIVDEPYAAALAERLLSPEMFSGWGVRTLGSDMARYNPVSYHNGSVWPHDNALIAAGLMRYGFVEQAQRIALALLDAAQAFGGRLPELFCGFSRDEHPTPVPYPTSCSPQAWAAATPIQLVRTLLRFEPDLPRGEMRLDPALPPALGRLHLEHVRLGGTRVSLDIEAERLDLSGLPDGLRRAT